MGSQLTGRKVRGNVDLRHRRRSALHDSPKARSRKPAVPMIKQGVDLSGRQFRTVTCPPKTVP